MLPVHFSFLSAKCLVSDIVQYLVQQVGQCFLWLATFCLGPSLCIWTDLRQFSDNIVFRMNKASFVEVSKEFIRKNVMDELQELEDAKCEMQKVDAVLDIVIYCLEHLTRIGYDVQKLFAIVHQANMNKFRGDAHLGADGKWVKPSDFVHPDAELEMEIARQRLVKKNNNNNPSLLKR